MNMSFMNMQYNGILGLLILAFDIWAVISIFQSGASNEKKATPQPGFRPVAHGQRTGTNKKPGTTQ